MNRNKKSQKNKKNKNKKNKNKNKKNKTQKIQHLPNNTLKEVDDISKKININVSKQGQLKESVLGFNFLSKNNDISYAPTINKELVSLKSISREIITDCNNDLAFKLKEGLEIGKKTASGVKCYPYKSKEGKDIMLKNLKANKHVNVLDIVPPKQLLGNCWFNTMFVTLFVSDKGRKFFHFFRQLMIEGNQKNNFPIPENIRDGFALLNYAIDACLSGNEYAYLLDTNSIIKQIYNNIPDEYKSVNKYITNINDAGNPIRYYEGIIEYLNNKSLELLRMRYKNDTWKGDIVRNIGNNNHMPHLIILEVYDEDNSGELKSDKPISFSIKGIKYMLDSCIIRDTNKKHFCATITCEKKEMAYDGMSYHRIVPMDWKKNINTEQIWEFEGSKGVDKKPIKWNFSDGYQLLFYYRVN